MHSVTSGTPQTGSGAFLRPRGRRKEYAGPIGDSPIMWSNAAWLRMVRSTRTWVGADWGGRRSTHRWTSTLVMEPMSEPPNAGATWQR